MDKYQQLRQYLSNFLSGPNIDALLNSLADELQRQEDLSIAVNDQLTISTASDVYLDKRLSEVGITRPSEIGMDDTAFRKMGIQINAAKQIPEAIHTVLATFYGDEVVRASADCAISAPYDLADGDDLIFALEDGEIHTLVVHADEFENIQQASAEELADLITRYIRSLGFDGFATVIVDPDTNERTVRILGGAKGPYSSVQILGGRIQNKLEFPQIRGTDLPADDTVWQITRNVGNRHRFRWNGSGSAPLLDKVFVGDKVMIYGQQFETLGISGTFEVKAVRPSQVGASFDSGYFEIDIEGFSALTPSAIDAAPPPNTITNTYYFTASQSSFQDVKFFLPKKNTPYSQLRYALAWEPTRNLLKVYMPATTRVVKRDLIGSAHVHLLYKSTELNGSFGSATEVDKKLHVLSEYSICYAQPGYDVLAYGGTLTHGLTTVDIDYIFRENGKTCVITKTPHGITGVADVYGNVVSNTIVAVTVTGLLEDNQDEPFNGPYIIDPSVPYTLTSQFVTTREKITSGETKSTLLVQGSLPNTPGELLFGLNQDSQESPVRYLAVQTSNSTTLVAISSISQVGTTVTVTTAIPHGLIAGEQTQISGTVNFNGVHNVTSVSSATIFTFTKTPAATLFEASGYSQLIIDALISTLVLDASYTFKNTHEIGTDVSLISSRVAYEPAPDGTDYGFYITGTADGRVFAEELVRQITALGINLEIVIVYPYGEGLGHGLEDLDGVKTNDVTAIWGV